MRPRYRGNGEEKDAQQEKAVNPHEEEGAPHHGHGKHTADPVAHQEIPHLLGPVEPTLDVSRAPAVKITHGQGEQSAGQEVQDGGVYSHRDEAQQELLPQVRKEHEQEGKSHRPQDDQ